MGVILVLVLVSVTYSGSVCLGDDATLADKPSARWAAQVMLVRTGRSTEIRLPNSPVSGRDLSLLDVGCEALSVLEFDNTQVPNVELAKRLARFPLLRQLVLHGPVDDKLLQVIAAQPSLRILNLPRGEFGDRGLKALVDAQQLELLRFSSSNVTDAGFISISRIPGLRFLHVIDTPLTDAGLKHLNELEKLESFYVDRCKISEKGLSELIDKLPELHLHWNDLHLPDDPLRHAD